MLYFRQTSSTDILCSVYNESEQKVKVTISIKTLAFNDDPKRMHNVSKNMKFRASVLWSC